MTAIFPKVRGYVVRRTVGADHDAVLACIRFACLVATRVEMLAGKDLNPGDRDDVRGAVGAGGENELLWPQSRARPPTQNVDDPFRFLFIVTGANALGRAPIVELHHLRIHLEP